MAYPFTDGTFLSEPFALLYTYDASTLVARATYTTHELDVENDNPVECDAAGRARVWLGPYVYRMVCKDEDGVTLWDEDGISHEALVLAADLADTSDTAKGDALVGVKSTLTGGVATTQHQVNSEVVSVFRFMTAAQIADVQAGTHLLDHAAAFQAAITAVCGASKTLWVPKGVYEFSVGMTFPNTSFCVIGESLTDTAISSSSSSDTLRLFDFTNCNGPAKLIENLSFNGQIGGASTSSVGVYSDIQNGLVIRHCWFRGLYEGVRKPNQSSYVHLLDCVFEFCTTGIYFDDAVQCSIQSSLFYRCVTDAYFTGDLDHLVWSNSIHSESNSFGVRLVGASRGKFSNLTFRQDFTAHTPDLIRLEAVCSYNLFDGASTGSASQGFGRVLVSLAASATCTRNRFLNLRAYGVLDAAIEVNAGSTNNTFTGQIDGVGTGVVDAGGSNYYRDMDIINCTTSAVLLSSVDNCQFSRVNMSGNTIDWVTSGTVPTVWVDEVDSTMAGLTPTRLGSLRAGIYGRTFYVTAVPAALAHLVGDRSIQRVPVVGQPKAWSCTVAGTPGTQVSEGNL